MVSASLQALLDQLDLLLGRRGRSFRFLLKGVQDVQRSFEADGVDRPVRVSVMGSDSSRTPRPPNPFSALGQTPGLNPPPFTRSASSEGPEQSRARKGAVQSDSDHIPMAAPTHGRPLTAPLRARLCFGQAALQATFSRTRTYRLSAGSCSVLGCSLRCWARKRAYPISSFTASGRSR